MGCRWGYTYTATYIFYGSPINIHQWQAAAHTLVWTKMMMMMMMPPKAVVRLVFTVNWTSGGATRHQLPSPRTVIKLCHFYLLLPLSCVCCEIRLLCMYTKKIYIPVMFKRWVTALLTCQVLSLTSLGIGR